MIKGYAINEKRLKSLEKTVQLLDIANRGKDRITGDEAKSILDVITSYTKALDLLDAYDHQSLKKVKGQENTAEITYDECINIIATLKYSANSNVFALERNKGLHSIIRNIYQTYDNQDVYPTVEEKAANFLYMIIKNHVFIDGNKRIAATLFIYFLQFYNILYKEGQPVIDNNTLVALTLLIAESNPKEKQVMVDLVLNFLT